MHMVIQRPAVQNIPVRRGGILADQGRVPGFQEHQFPGKRVAVILEEQAVPDEENVAALGTAGFQLIK